MWSSYKNNLPIDGIHFQPLIPERKRALMQMLRIERHFAEKKHKLSKPIQDEGEEDKPRQKKSKSSSSLNSITFNQL